MKQIKLFCMVIFLVLLVVLVGIKKWKMSYHLASKENDMHDAVNAIKIQDIDEAMLKRMVVYMNNNYSYKHDMDQFEKKDYWQSPENMFRMRKGDGEDLAIFLADISKKFCGKVGI